MLDSLGLSKVRLNIDDLLYYLSYRSTLSYPVAENPALLSSM